MKIYVAVLVFLVLSSIGTKAQKIHFTDETNVWRGVHIDGSSGNPNIILTSGYTFRYLRDTILQNTRYHVIGSTATAAIREDTLLGKVYFRFITQRIRDYEADTGEHVLYDYNLQVGDTFRTDNAMGAFYAVVNAMDSTLIAGNYYKIWHFSNTHSPTYGNLALGTIVEGIGSVGYPLWPVSFIDFEDAFQLHCFSNAGSQPSINPAIRLPFYASSTNWGPPTTDYFNNTTSCTLDVNEFGHHKSIGIFPNPGGKEIVFETVPALNGGTMIIYNSTGQIMVKADLKDVTVINVGQWLDIPGVYFCDVRDSKFSHIYSGSFIFR